MYRIIEWLNRLLFTPTPIAAGMVRIALAIHFMLILDMSFYHPVRWFASKPETLYQPVGIMGIYNHHTPPVTMIVSLVWIARIGVIFMLVGLLTRTAIMITTIALWHCCSAFYSFDASPSHTFIPGMFAGIGLLFASRSPLSLDYCLHRYWSADRGNHYWNTPRVGVFLTLFAVSWPLANAALFKVYLGNKQPFAWIYSDNLRNALIFQWWKFQEPLPWYGEWIVARGWASKLLALGNVVAQATPVIACFVIRKPRFKLLIALLILSEIIGLTLLMNMWNGYGRLWLCFMFFFIDWDSLTHRWWPRSEMAIPARRTTMLTWLGVGVLTIPWVVMTCTPKYYRQLFPIQPFSMFSNIQAHTPYWQEKPYANLVTEWAIHSDPPISERQQAEIFRSYHAVFHDRGPVAVEKIRAECENAYKLRVNSIVCTQAFHVVPPIPATTVEQHHRSTYVKWQRTELGGAIQLVDIESIQQIKSEPDFRYTYLVKLRFMGRPPKEISFGYFDGLNPELIALPHTERMSQGYEFVLRVPPKRNNQLIVIIADGETWFGYNIQGSP